MPFYEYECQACKYYAEVMQKISDPPLTRCPSCGKRALKKLLSVPVFRLKGGGWYETDFKSDKETKRNLLGPEKEESKAEAKTGTTEASSGGIQGEQGSQTCRVRDHKNPWPDEPRPRCQGPQRRITPAVASLARQEHPQEATVAP